MTTLQRTLPRHTPKPPPVDVERRSVVRALVVGMVLATLFGAGLRFYQLDRASIWVDELYTVRAISVIDDVHRSKVLGYLPTAAALWWQGIRPSDIPADSPELWRAMGITEGAIRVAACVIGVLSIPVLALAARPLIGWRAALFLAFLLAAAPWHIDWSQAGRFYTQQFLFYNLALLAYFAATRPTSPRRMMWAWGLVVLAFATQPPGLVIVAVFAADWLIAWLRGAPIRLGPVGLLIGFVAIGVCAMLLATDVRQAPDEWGQFVGSHAQPPLVIGAGAVYMIQLPVAALAVFTGIWLVRERPRLGIYLLAGAVVPLLVLGVLATTHFVHVRYAFVCLFAWLVLAAIGLDRLWAHLRPSVGPVLAAAPAAILAASLALPLYAYHTGAWSYNPRWGNAFAYVAEHRQPGEDVVADLPIVAAYYLGDSDIGRTPGTAKGLAAVTRPTWIVVLRESAVGGPRLSWLAEAASLHAYFDLRVTQPYSSVRVYRYEPAPPAPDTDAAVSDASDRN